MIRKHKETDLEEILSLWYQAQSIAHPFLSTDFVNIVKKAMREIYIPNSETGVYEVDGKILRFISMLENEIGGLFVMPEEHSKGIGTKLVDFISPLHPELEVEVFKKNKIGRAFYDKYGFKVFDEQMNKESGFEVLRMKIIC